MIDALRDPRRYPHAVAAVTVLETHISWVLLTGRYAYKLKRPVALGFLDFSTLEARKAACEEELRLNRRTAPDLYLDVVPVTGTDADPRLGGKGRAIDYAVKMHEFPQDALLDRVAARGALKPELMDELAAEVAAFHAQVARAGPGSEFGSPAEVIAQARQNFDQVRALGPDPGSAAALRRLAAWTEREFARRERVFAARRDAGFVRECHGDLHLRNLLLLDGRILAFDCIEFNASLRWIDVMSEVAFVVMDLADHGFAAHAGRFLDAYLEETGDYAGLACLRFYLVYRAIVRAKVACMRAHQLPVGARERVQAERELRDYLRLAERFVALERRALILTRGLSGSGKTVFSGLLVEELGAIRVRSDVERKRLHALAADDRSCAALGGGIYTQDAARRTYARLREIARIVLDAGFPAVADATFLRRTDREAMRALARQAGAIFAIAACEAPEPVLRERILARARAGGDASEATLDVLAKQLATAEPLADAELDVAVRVDTTLDRDGLRARAAALGAELGVDGLRRTPARGRDRRRSGRGPRDRSAARGGVPAVRRASIRRPRYRHILVPTDGSKLSERAVRIAVRLARVFGSRLTAIYVVPEGVPTLFSGDKLYGSGVLGRRYKALMRSQGREALAVVERLAGTSGVACSSIRSIAPRPWRAILQAATRSRCDLIVMASHGREGLGALALGSQTTRVLAHSSIPVLVCR